MKGDKILVEVNSEIVGRTLNLSEEKPVFAAGAIKPFVKAGRQVKVLGPNSENCGRDHGDSVGKPQRRHHVLLEKKGGSWFLKASLYPGIKNFLQPLVVERSAQIVIKVGREDYVRIDKN
jgi:hypothetical protein